MLIIRQAQYAALEQSALELWLDRHLTAHFPELSDLYPGERRVEFIREGIVKAKARGFTSGPHVAHWLNLMVLLGPSFDQDSEDDWPGEILRRSEPPAIKIQELLRAAEQRVWGTFEP